MINICFISVGVAAVLHFVLAYAWYDKLFGAAWLASIGRSKEEAEAKKAKGMKKALLISFICSFLLVLATIHFVATVKAATILAALCALACPVIGFILAPIAMGIEFENRKWSYFFITGGYLVAGVIIAVVVNSLISPYTIGPMN